MFNVRFKVTASQDIVLLKHNNLSSGNYVIFVYGPATYQNGIFKANHETQSSVGLQFDHDTQTT